MRRGFGQMLQDILTRGDKFVVERHGTPVAVVVPIEVYEQWKQNRERFFETLTLPHKPLRLCLKKKQLNWPMRQLRQCAPNNNYESCPRHKCLGQCVSLAPRCTRSNPKTTLNKKRLSL